jgi:hypothetical protein
MKWTGMALLTDVLQDSDVLKAEEMTRDKSTISSGHVVTCYDISPPPPQGVWLVKSCQPIQVTNGT